MTKQYVVLAPCFNESSLIVKFIKALLAELSEIDHSFSIVIVDDGSTDDTRSILERFTIDKKHITFLPLGLEYNMGHQQAIKQGLRYIQSLDLSIDRVIVMDSDGEDDPSAIKELVQHTSSDIVFVERGKRRENLSFKVGYRLYQQLFRVVSGKNISFGNYSMISMPVVKVLVDQHFFHYAGFLSKQRFSIHKLQYDRAQRIDGKSKMSYQSLIFHGLYSMVEYAEEILFTLIKLFVLVLLGIGGLGMYLFYSKFISNNAIPGWASSIGVSLIISSLIIVSTVILGLLIISVKKSNNNQSINYRELN